MMLWYYDAMGLRYYDAMMLWGYGDMGIWLILRNGAESMSALVPKR